MHKPLEGILRNGRVELTEPLSIADGTRVLVTVIDQAAILPPHRPMTRGMLASRDGPHLTGQDAKVLKQLWEREWERSWDRLDKQ